MKKLIILIIGLSLFAACNNSNDPKLIKDKPLPDLGQHQQGMMSPTTEKTAVLLEAVDGGTYTYLKLESEGKEFWGAVTAMELETGKTYYYTESVWMKDFESKTLGKTFDEILFIDYIGETSKQAEVASPHTGGGQHVTAGKMENISVELTGDEISLEELFRNKDKYKDQQLTVKGAVVKVNLDIMDRNWIHIQDGTSHEGMFDLTVTTTEQIKFDLNDIVTFKGTLTLDKDFGAGYFYKVILEESHVVE